jgi:TolA-binding protein
MTATPDEATVDARCEEARRLATDGDLEAAERIFAEVVALGDTPARAQAAMGLAAVRYDLGDVPGAREADRVAIASEHPEYAPRAACHLAMCAEHDGAADEARAAWQRVLGFGNPAYLPAAHYSLGNVAEQAGDLETATGQWREAAASGDTHYAPLAAHALGAKLLDDGDPAAAQRVFADVAGRVPAETAARLWTSLAISHLEQALGALGRALDADDPDVTPLAVELMARVLPLRGHDDTAAQVWEHGLGHADPRVADDVRARLRRGFGIDEHEAAADDDGEPRMPHWWEPYLETAAYQGTLPLLTAELFGAIDRLHDTVAVPYVRAGRRVPAEIRDALGAAVRVPGDYAWGGDLHDNFRGRFAEATGSRDTLPEGWPGDGTGAAR